MAQDNKFQQEVKALAEPRPHWRKPIDGLLDVYARAFYPEEFKPEKAAAWRSVSEQVRAAGHSVSARVPSP
jgi:hypothetical protein